MCKLKPITKQFLVVACSNILVLGYGLSTGWATINFVELQSENTTYPTGPLDQQESSLVVSIGSIGGFLGNYVILPLRGTIGIKRTIHFLCIPLIIGSILTIWAKNVYYLYVSRLLTGIVGGGLAVGLPSFINDRSHDSVRGALNSLFDPFNNTGMIISFFLGNYLSCVDQAKTQLIPPLIFFIILFFVPEVPDYWVSRNKNKKAMKSHRFYRGSIIELSQPNKSEFLPVPQNEKQIENGNENTSDESNSPLTFGDFCTPHARRAFFISFTSLILSFLSGTLSLMSYATYIFNETGSSLSEMDSTILVSITTLVANLVLLNIVERFNRRTLYIWSSFITTACYFLFAAYEYLWLKQPGFEWMPPFCFACIVYFSFMGLLPIPYIVTIEIFPKKIRQTCLALAISSIWLILFILGATFIPFVEACGLFNCMIVFGFACLLNAVFGIFFLPETRGKSYEEIVEIMNS